MNRYEQEKANDIKRIAVALEKLTKLLTKVIKDNAQRSRANETI